MDPELIERRVAELMRSPLGCAMLHIMAEEGVAPSHVVRPVSAMGIVADAYRELIPWTGHHDMVEEFVLAKGPEYCDLARALVTEPGIEWWWSPLDRDQQVWVEGETRLPFRLTGLGGSRSARRRRPSAIPSIQRSGCRPRRWLAGRRHSWRWFR